MSKFITEVNYNKILSEIDNELTPYKGKGEIASYIPELKNVNADAFGLHLQGISGKSWCIGECSEKFSIQSISKVLTVAMAFSILGESLWKRVGVEPSGTAFNSLVQLEYEHGIPRNPLINSGAIVMADILLTHLKKPADDFLNFVRKISGESNVCYNNKVAKSEKDTGYRNAAMVNLMKSFGNIENDVNDVLDFYYLQCSLEMTCKELANSFLLFANNGIIPRTNERVLTISQTKRINALMQTCGFYDEAGEFTFKVGLPGKSGVGGGIIAVCPGEFAVATWSPRLNKKGNSLMGMKALELLTTKTELSIF